MDEKGFQNEAYLQRHYAGQALIGLLANGRLNESLSLNNELSKEGADRLAFLTCEIGVAMAKEVMARPVRH